MKSRIIIFLIIMLFVGFFCLGFTYLQKGKPAVDFSLKNINGKKVQLSDFKGKKVFLHFWATWCPPCREELPSIQKFYKKTNILMISLDKKETDVKKFIKENGYTFPVLVDSNGSVAQKYGVTAIPTTFIIDEKGIIIDKIIGSRDWSK